MVRRDRHRALDGLMDLADRGDAETPQIYLLSGGATVPPLSLQLRGRWTEPRPLQVFLAVILADLRTIILAPVGTDALHLVGACALLGACTHDTGDLHRLPTALAIQSILRVHFFLLLRSGLVWGFDDRRKKKVFRPISYFRMGCLALYLVARARRAVSE